MRRFASVASGLFAALAGCGDDGGARHLADAPPTEDGQQPDTPPGVTTVNITAYARFFEGLPAMTPRQGARVFAVSPANVVVATAMTDADGKATVELPTGGSVTIAYPETQDGTQFYRSWVTSYAGVKPGDHLVVGDSFQDAGGGGADLGSETVRWPALANATLYRLYTPCDRYATFTPPTEMATIDLYSGCHVATSPLVIVAYDGGNVIGSIHVPSVTHANGATHDLTAQGWTTQANTPNFMSVLTGLPADGNVDWLGARGNYGPWSIDQVTTDIPIAGGMASAMSSVPSTAPRQTAVARVTRAGAVGRQFFAMTGTSPVSINAGTMPMFVEEPAVDEKARKVTWTVPAGTYDHAAVQFRWSYLVGDDTHAITWNAIVPPGVAEIDASAVPAELAQLVPPATDFNLVNVRLVDLSNAASYDAARALPEWSLVYPIESVHNGALPGAAMADGGEGGYPWEPYFVPH